MAKPTSILVLGSGELGMAVVLNLAQHPQRGDTHLTVLKRSTNDTQNFQAHGIEVIHADMVTASQDQLADIFRPFHTVINCNGMFLPPKTQIKTAQAALQASVGRYFPWQFGVDYDTIGPDSAQDLFATQLQVRAILRAQEKVPWLIVSTGMFTSFLFEPAFGLVDVKPNEAKTRVTAIGSWDNSLTVTSPGDIGRLVAEMALVDRELAGVVFVAGDTISMARLADVVEEVGTKGVERELKTVEMLEDELKNDPDNYMKKYRVVFGKGIGVSWPKEATYGVQKGMDLETVDEWARSHWVEKRTE